MFSTSSLQESYQAVVFTDFQFARDNQYDGRIWSTHYKLIGKYRDNLAVVGYPLVESRFMI